MFLSRMAPSSVPKLIKYGEFLCLNHALISASIVSSIVLQQDYLRMNSRDDLRNAQQREGSL